MKAHANIIIIFFITIFSSCQAFCIKTDLGAGYTVDCLSRRFNTDLADSMNHEVISAHILEYAYDSDFILVVQRPWEDPSVSGWHEMTAKQHDIAFANSKFCQYWIVNKKEKEEWELNSF